MMFPSRPRRSGSGKAPSQRSRWPASGCQTAGVSGSPDTGVNPLAIDIGLSRPRDWWQASLGQTTAMNEKPKKTPRVERANPWVLAKTTLELISAHGCLPSPKAYEVFFAYASGDGPVRAMVDDIAKSDGMITSFDLDRIHHSHFRTNDGEWERQQQASYDIEESVRAAIAGIDDHLRVGKAYGKSLEMANGRIGRSASVEDLSGVVKDLLAETDSFQTASAAVRANLVALLPSSSPASNPGVPG